ncbi:MAG: carboxypeptidase regulatory-like domain-containing protein [Gemmatimonadetes bacterium]|nr:carboxypeptidase regulatory-like domain-containing protein [Gemmatimonadota bacterium]
MLVLIGGIAPFSRPAHPSAGVTAGRCAPFRPTSPVINRFPWPFRLCSAFALAVALTATASSAGGQTVDVIRGRVTGPERQPLEGAQVTVTTLSGAVSRQARSDANGRYTVTFPGGDGDYFVTFNAIGYAPRRYEIKRIADEDILIADAEMQRTATSLGAVRVQGDRVRPDRNQAQADISGTERAVNTSALTAAQQGEIAAMAASVPGVLLVPGADGDPSGFSVLGLDPSQNSTTLNGQNFGGADIPRDAAVGGALTTSPYDVSRGGFSGANFNLRTQSGTNFILRTNSLNLDAPQLQWTDAAAQELGNEYSNTSLSGRVSGPIRYNKAFYNMAYQLGRRSNDLQSLLNTSARGLQTSGIAADSVTRLLAILQRLGVPAVIGRAPSDRVGDQGSVLGSFDFSPPSSRAGSAYSVAVNASWNRQSPIGNLTAEMPAHSGDRFTWNAGSQLRHSFYFESGVLTESTIGLTSSRAATDPYLLLPGGSVRINSTFPDGTNGVKSVAFGGNAALDNATTNGAFAFTNLLSWFSLDNKHRVKLSTELRYDRYGLDQALNGRGTFSYLSLADLDAGRPATYGRTLQPRIRDGGQFIGAVSLGDSYRRTNRLQIQYGVRLDGNYYGDRPERNTALEQAIGVRNDVAPNRIYLSPRVGFSWNYGTAAQIGAFEGAFRGPRATVRGGVGLFQGNPATQALSGALDNTGLPTGLQQIVCTGLAVPAPNWPSYANGTALAPSTCADGSTGSVFSNSAPNVTLYDDRWNAPRSIRSNLQWSGAILGNRFNGNFEVTYSLNLAQAGTVDANFLPTQRLSLAGEAGRPVFVQPSSIDTRTGAIATRDARVTTAYNRVTESRSDLRSESRQFRATISPLTFSSRLSWNASYVYTNVRERSRGFGGNTAGNPLDFQWARSNFDSRHQVQYSLFYNAFDLVRVGWTGGFRSGTPFTPMVGSDVNGDGSANDRAFVYDGSISSDPTLSIAMAQLLDDAPSYVQDCLRKQAGRLARRNSCQGPWTSQANLSISLNPVKFRMPQRAILSFSVSNPIGALDMLMHGSDRQHGWGQPAVPDQNLLYVRGFDAVNNRFRYEVNQRFGSASPLLTATRTPVVATAQFRFDIGPTRERQSLTQQMNIGRRNEGNKLPEGVIKSIYANGGMVNPIAQVLRQSDTLKLTAKQADSLATLNRWYLIRLDSVWTPVARSLAALPERYDEGTAYAQYKKGREATVDLLRNLAPKVKGLLTDAQRRQLPALVTSYLDPRFLSSIRSGTAGAGGNPFGGGGGPIAIPAGAGMQVIAR